MGSLQAFIRAVVAALMLVSAVEDIRERRFPPVLFAGLAIACACACLSEGGMSRLVLHIILALLVCGVLVAFELAWRRTHSGVPGLGMGDIKFLFAFMLWRPNLALSGFILGLLSLAAYGAIRRERSFPLLPFTVGSTAFLVCCRIAFL